MREDCIKKDGSYDFVKDGQERIKALNSGESITKKANLIADTERRIKFHQGKK